MMLFIHGACISWRMWLPVVDFFKTDYFVIVPALDGHDLEKPSTFTTVEKAAEDICEFVAQHDQPHVFLLCGASLGGTIAVEILAQGHLEVKNAIIDGAPLKPMQPLLLQFAIQTRLMQIKSMTKWPALYDRLLKSMPERIRLDMLAAAGILSGESIRNLHRSAFRYTIPAPLAAARTRIAYWYGSKEAIYGKPYSSELLSVLPGAEIKVFQGLNHGDLALCYPKRYIQKIQNFINPE
jgi:pimeloyl-ACP methyl ester carboxylesterase